MRYNCIVLSETMKAQFSDIFMLPQVLVVCGILLFYTVSGKQHTLVGQWTFEDGEVFVDLIGNFGDIILEGAKMDNGQLDLGVDKWARTNGLYHGPTIYEKTMVSWASLDSFSPAQGNMAGSILSIDELFSYDVFDAIVFGEMENNHWLAGSNLFDRSENPSPGYEESVTNVIIQMAISYKKVSGSMAHIRLYRNGEVIGDYVKGNLANWQNDIYGVEVLWGPRHKKLSGGAFGNIDAHIEESRIYGEVLGSEDIRRLYPKGINILIKGMRTSRNV